MEQLQELISWIEKEQDSLSKNDMTEHQLTIFATLQLVKKQAEYVMYRDIDKTKKVKQQGSPGHYGC